MLVPPRDIRQLDDWSCGPSCIEAISGTRPTVGSPGFGTSIWGMLDALRGLGYSCTHGTAWDLEDLKYQTSRGRYVVALINSGGVSHWVVVWKVSRGRIHVHDPEKGPREIPWPTWLQLWDSSGYSSLGISVAGVSEGR